MSPSPARLPLVVETLVVADAAYGTVIEIQKLATEGRQADALHLLAMLAEGCTSHRPIIRGVLAAERQAAQAYDLTQRPTVRVLASIGVAQPHPHAANSQAQSPSPEQPSPSVA